MSADSVRHVGHPPPAVTVVVPTKDRRALLDSTLAGLLAQADVELQVVVVDDGSTDGTGDALAARDDRRIRVLRNETAHGVVAARNRGLAAARTDWVAFCDDDDLWAPGKLAAQIAAAQRSGRTWAVTGAVGFESDGTVRYATLPEPDEELAAQLPWHNAVPGGCSNVVVRRELVEAVGGFDPRFRVLADWELWTRLGRLGPPATVAAALVGYRMHDANMSTRPDGVLAELHLLEELTADARGGRPLGPACHRWLAASLLRGGDRRGAAVAFCRAASLQHPALLLRALASLTVPSPGWELARRLSGRGTRHATPPWLQELLSREQSAGRAGP